MNEHDHIDYHPRRRAVYREGDSFDKLKLVRRAVIHSINGSYISGGWWIAECDCGTQDHKVHTRSLRLKLLEGRMCTKCGEREKRNPTLPVPAPDINRSSVPGRRPHDISGMRFGRFVVERWEPGIGWLCRCDTCGGQEVCRHGLDVFRRGVADCDGTCV